MNDIIADYGRRFELREDGTIVARAPEGLEDLLEAPLASGDDSVDRAVADAIAKFRRRTASEDDQMDDLRDLANVLERIRPQARKVLTHRDESDLFRIVNNFGGAALERRTAALLRPRRVASVVVLLLSCHDSCNRSTLVGAPTTSTAGVNLLGPGARPTYPLTSRAGLFAT